MKIRWSRSALFATAAWLAGLLGAVPIADSIAAPAASAAAEAASSADLGDVRKRAAAGDSEAQYDLGVAMLCQSNRLRRRDRAQATRLFAEAARPLEAAAKQGHVSAQSVLGWMLMSGEPGIRNNEKASVWLLRAAEKNDTAAQNNLGVLYATGQGVKRDEKAAERWFRAAADQGAEEATKNLEALHGRTTGRAAATRASGGLHPALVRAGCAGATSRT